MPHISSICRTRCCRNIRDSAAQSRRQSSAHGLQLDTKVHRIICRPLAMPALCFSPLIFVNSDVSLLLKHLIRKSVIRADVCFSASITKTVQAFRRSLHAIEGVVNCRICRPRGFVKRLSIVVTALGRLLPVSGPGGR